jgi:hypothetical protein
LLFEIELTPHNTAHALFAAKPTRCIVVAMNTFYFVSDGGHESKSKTFRLTFIILLAVSLSAVIALSCIAWFLSRNYPNTQLRATSGWMINGSCTTSAATKPQNGLACWISVESHSVFETPAQYNQVENWYSTHHWKVGAATFPNQPGAVLEMGQFSSLWFDEYAKTMTNLHKIPWPKLYGHGMTPYYLDEGADFYLWVKW